MASRPEPRTGQNLHLVFGGELESLSGVRFRDIDGLDIVGVYGSRAEAEAAWKGSAQRTVDNALMRYFIVDLHELIDPLAPGGKSRGKAR
jgi:hypothetical protein